MREKEHGKKDRGRFNRNIQITGQIEVDLVGKQWTP